MSAFPGGEGPLQGQEPLPESDVDVYAHIEGLSREEEALLAVPRHERSEAQHERLREIEAELERIWEHLAERARRLGRHHESQAD